MARAVCLIAIDGALVITSDVTGKRYRFTRQERELEIDDCDVAQFDGKRVHISACGCTGTGQDLRSKTVKVFAVVV